jgi:antitoxin (DNA-binding transcriptional repressor) of toxin-antitoxin stability system
MLGYTLSMRTAKIGELKARLSAHIEYVKRGRDVLILDRNTPVARLTRVDPTDDYDERIRRLIAKGILSPPLEPGKMDEPWPEPPGPTRITRKIMDQVWREERDAR